MSKILLCILILQILGAVCDEYKKMRCSGTCDFHESGNSCDPRYSGIPRSECITEIQYNECPYACMKDNVGICRFIKHTLPSFEIINPFFDYSNKSSCTDDYQKSICSCKCEYDNNVGHCIPMIEDDFCGKKIEWTCPFGCQYNITENKCIPTINIYNCDCPTGCFFNKYINKCVTTNGKICGNSFNKQIKCNSYCGKDIKCCKELGNECQINNMNNLDICEPTIKAKCPTGYYFDIEFPKCTRYNRNSVCKIDNITIEYPLRISEKIGIIECKYFIELACEKMPGKVTKCPSGCNLNILKNKCESKDAFCGTVQLKNPIFMSHQNNTFDNCHCFKTNYCLCCDNDDILLDYITSTSSVFRCGPKWYYE